MSVIAASAAAAAEEQTPGEAARVFAVSQTFDNKPFDYRMELRSQTPGYHVYRLSYPSPVVTPFEQNNTVPADYYLPDGIAPGDAKRPAVICLHILDGDFELVHITCSVLAARGIPAIMFKLPYYGERGLPGGRKELAANPKLFVGALQQAYQDVRRTIDVLAARPEVDPQRIGVTGISMGAIVAASAAGAESRLSRVGLILAGGDLMTIVHHARETQVLDQMIRRLPPPERAELEKTIDLVDPLRHAAGLRQRAEQGKVLMINAAQDEVIPRACTEKLATALGMENKVIWLEGLGHYTAMAALPQALRTTADFFAQDLPPGVKAAPPAVPRRSAPALLASIMQQVGTVLTAEPAPGRCHFVDLEAKATLKDGKPVEGQLRFVHGAGGKFALRCKLPVVGEAALGQGAFPWMASGEKIVFRGKLAPGAAAGNPLAFTDPKSVGRVKMLAGILTAVALAPDMLQRWVTVADDAAAGQPRAIHVSLRENEKNRGDLVLKDDGATPDSLTFDVEGVRGTVKFRVWQLNTAAPDAIFDEPIKLPVQEVDAADLYRMFSAMFDFAVENVQ